MKRGASAAGLEGSRGVTPEDAHELLTGVWERLGVGAHASLVGMLRSFREGSLPMHALCARSEQLLAGQPDLLAAFQEFVPRPMRGTLGPQRLQDELAAQAAQHQQQPWAQPPPATPPQPAAVGPPAD